MCILCIRETDNLNSIITISNEGDVPASIIIIIIFLLRLGNKCHSLLSTIHSSVYSCIDEHSNEHIFHSISVPGTLVCDQGPDFLSQILLLLF